MGRVGTRDSVSTGPGEEKGGEGAKDTKGNQGAAGDKSDAGPEGPRGDKGDTGATGPQGPKGEQGPKGDTGDTGPQGDTGPVGPAGPQGHAGADGAPGADGKSAYQYAQDGGYHGTEAEFAAKLAQEKFANPNALTFTGAVTGSYDGSMAVSVEIPSAVTDDHINSLIDAKLGVIENGSY